MLPQNPPPLLRPPLTTAWGVASRSMSNTTQFQPGVVGRQLAIWPSQPPTVRAAFQDLHELSISMVYRDFTRVGGAKMPHAKTMGRWGVAVGPAVVRQIHDR
jgi:hypothetical protein